MAHIVRENAGKKTKMISELFTYKIFEFTFVSIFADMTIPNLLPLIFFISILAIKLPLVWKSVANQDKFWNTTVNQVSNLKGI